MGRLKIKKKDTVMPLRETMAYRMMLLTRSMMFFVYTVYDMTVAVAVSKTLSITALLTVCNLRQVAAVSLSMCRVNADARPKLDIDGTRTSALTNPAGRVPYRGSASVCADSRRMLDSLHFLRDPSPSSVRRP